MRATQLGSASGRQVRGFHNLACIVQDVTWVARIRGP